MRARAQRTVVWPTNWRQVSTGLSFYTVATLSCQDLAAPDKTRQLLCILHAAPALPWAVVRCFIHEAPPRSRCHCKLRFAHPLPTHVHAHTDKQSRIPWGKLQSVKFLINNLVFSEAPGHKTHWGTHSFSLMTDSKAKTNSCSQTFHMQVCFFFIFK